MFVLALTRLKLGLLRDGLTLLLKNMYIMSFFGSTQKHVPVNPVCPTTSAGASSQVEEFAWLFTFGLSKPSPLKLFGLLSVKKVSTVAGFKYLTPPYDPRLSHI